MDYLTLCLSPKADQVPKLTPFLTDPLITPIQKNPVLQENDPTETFKVTNPKPIEDLWLYTALPIAVDWKAAVSLTDFELTMF